MAKPHLRLKPHNITLRLFLDEGVPNEVGKAFEERGHAVTYGNKSLLRGAVDQIVCATALKSDAILVAADHDMKTLAKSYGISNQRFKTLSLIKISCRKPDAANKIRQAMSLIEHEWEFNSDVKGRRIWIEIRKALITTLR